MRLRMLSILIQLLLIQSISATSRPPVDERIQWWQEARFGMFIHWGVYAMYGGVYKGHRQAFGDAAWIENRCKIPVAEYRVHSRDFNPQRYDPDFWAKTARDAGMKYLIITAKHHDGFALFDSKHSDWDVTDATVYGKDLLKPLAQACKKYGIRLGFYYSQANDWTNPGGAVARRPMRQGWPNPDTTRIDQYTLAHNGSWDPVQETATFDDYVDQVAIPQVRELLTHYGKVDVLWWDYGTQMRSARGAKELEELLEIQPHIITNDRLHPDFPGDTKTPEQQIPSWDQIDRNEYWETCMTMNNSWGYKSFDNKWKSSETLIRNLVKIVARGGNYLLNVGPKPDGTFPDESLIRLQEIGEWMKVNSQAIHGTEMSPFNSFPWGECTIKREDAHTLCYFFIFDWPTNNELSIPILTNKAISAEILTNGEKVKIVQNNKGVRLLLPEKMPDPVATVVKVKIKGNVDHNIPGVQKHQMQSGAID